MNLPEYVGASSTSQLGSTSFGPRYAVELLILAVAAYAVILLLASLLSSVGVEDQICLALVHAGGVIALALFWKKGRWGNARYDSFGAAILILGVVFRIHALVDALIYGARLESIYKYRNVPVEEPVFDLLLKGEFITVMAFLIIASSWRVKVGRNVERHSFIRASQNVPLKISLLIYGSAFAVDVARRLSGVHFGPLEQIASLLFVTGIASIYFIAERRRVPIGKVMRACLLALPLSLLALDSGMKEEILFPFIPAGIIFWTNFKELKTRIAALTAAVVLLAVSNLYVHHVRDLSWKPGGDVNLPTAVLISSFMDSLQNFELVNALDRISSRVNMTTAHAITVTLADHFGHEPVEVFGLIPASVVPRAFWPDKPVMQPGATHTARILGISGPVSEIRSATAAGFAAELYLGGWWFGVIIGAISYGLLLATAQQWAFRFGYGFGHQTLCFIALYWTLRFDEKHVVYAYTSIIFACIFIWMLVKTTTVLGFRGARSSGYRRYL